MCAEVCVERKLLGLWIGHAPMLFSTALAIWNAPAVNDPHCVFQIWKTRANCSATSALMRLGRSLVHLPLLCSTVQDDESQTGYRRSNGPDCIVRHRW